MKKVLTILSILTMSYSAHSQILISLLLGDKLNSDKLEFGLDGGLNIATIHGTSQGTAVRRFNLGFYFDIKLKNPTWLLHTGVIVKSTLGAHDFPAYDLGNADLNAAFAGGSVDRRLNYFNVPILMKHLFKNNFSVEAGPMLGLMAKSTDVFTKKVVDKDDLTYKLRVRNQYHPLDAGVMIGLGYRLSKGNGMNLGIRYYYGLVDTTIDDSTPNQYNRSLYFTFGIPIGVKDPNK